MNIINHSLSAFLTNFQSITYPIRKLEDLHLHALYHTLPAEDFQRLDANALTERTGGLASYAPLVDAVGVEQMVAFRS